MGSPGGSRFIKGDFGCKVSIKYIQCVNPHFEICSKQQNTFQPCRWAGPVNLLHDRLVPNYFRAFMNFMRHDQGCRLNAAGGPSSSPGLARRNAVGVQMTAERSMKDRIALTGLHPSRPTPPEVRFSASGDCNSAESTGQHC